MKKFYENPFITVERFDAENIVTASGGTEGSRFDGDIDTGLSAYTVKTIDASTIEFTF